MKYLRLEQIEEVVSYLEECTAEERRAFFSDPENALAFWYYYFPQNFRCFLAEFHYVWIFYVFCSRLDLLFEAFRGALKTEIIKVYLVWNACYGLEPYSVVQSFDSDSSEEMLRAVAKMLVSKKLRDDYGDIYPLENPKDDLSKKSITNFETTTGCKFVARSLGEKIRGASTFDDETGSARPTLLVLDDIDTTDSVRNKEIIDKNYQKITQETIGAMSKERARVIFNGNTIAQDGIVRRFVAEKEWDPSWKVFRQPLFDADGKSVWPEMFTPETIAAVRSKEGAEAFKQNYLLIPSRVVGTTVFDMEKQYKFLNPIATWRGWKIYGHVCDKVYFGIDVSEGRIDGDYMVVTGKSRGKTVLQFRARVNEKQLAIAIGEILNDFHEDGKRFVGQGLVECNTGRALINEILAQPWGRSFLLPFKHDDQELGEEGDYDDYGFRTTRKSKHLLIKQYRIALEEGDVQMSEDCHAEMQTFVWDRTGQGNAQAPNHDDAIMSEMIAHHASLNYPAREYPEDRTPRLRDLIQNDIRRAWDSKNQENSPVERFDV